MLENTDVNKSRIFAIRLITSFVDFFLLDPTVNINKFPIIAKEMAATPAHRIPMARIFIIAKPSVS